MPHLGCTVAPSFQQESARFAMGAFLRFLAACLLLVAVIAAVDDITRSRSTSHAVVTPAFDHWAKLAPATFSNAKGAVSRSTHPAVWDYGVRVPLQLPTWALFGVIGLVLAYAGRRRRRVNIYAN
jgi:hypothetical protein